MKDPTDGIAFIQYEACISKKNMSTYLSASN